MKIKEIDMGNRIRNWPTPHGMDNEGNPRKNGPTGNELGRAVTKEEEVRDYKEVWSEAYYDALETGLEAEQAAARADDVASNYLAGLVDQAWDLKKEEG